MPKFPRLSGHWCWRFRSISQAFWSLGYLESPDLRRMLAYLKNGFTHSHIIEATGFSGGIWILWNDCWTIEILESHTQYIHLKILNSNGLVSLITTIYSSHVRSQRYNLWHNLNRLQFNTSEPLALMGYFNAISSVHERQGGSSKRTGICPHFANWFQSYGLINLEIVGPKFTWRRGTLSEHLDCTVCNLAWGLKFPESFVYHLAHNHSNHRPLLLRLQGLVPNKAKRPFRFMQMWPTHNGFSHFLKSNWSGCPNLMSSIKQLTDNLHHWNQVFGNIFR